MKTMFTLAIAWIALTHSTNSLAASSVSVIIDGETYSCSKGGNDDTRDCTVTKGGERDKYGTECKPFHRGDFCAAYYDFGHLTQVQTFSTASEAANWCRGKVGR